MKKLNYSFIRIIFALIIGLILVLWPDAAIEYIILTRGVLFIASGLITLLSYLAGQRKKGGLRSFPVDGVGAFLLGLMLVIMPNFFANVFTFILGFILLLGGIQQIASLTSARRWIRVPLGFYVVPSLILLAGILSLFNPIGVRETALMIIGVACIVYAVSELINWFKFTRYRNKKQDISSSHSIEDAVIIEEQDEEDY